MGRSRDLDAPARGACAVCGAPSGGSLCARHSKAARKIEAHFATWRERAGVEWEEYLRLVSENDLSGAWIKETAEYLLRSGMRFGQISRP
uniref:Uncharacterized protein n=1 Tax=Candidatus Methanomethylicus mesodigestus TaxID=1867258 RepID=A0A7C3F520_9CREN